jgi:hypothetical protein
MATHVTRRHHEYNCIPDLCTILTVESKQQVIVGRWMRNRHDGGLSSGTTPHAQEKG